MIKLTINKIVISAMVNGSAYVELFVTAHTYGEFNQLVDIDDAYGSVKVKYEDMTPITLGYMADDGVITADELMRMVGVAGNQWVAERYDGLIVDGVVILEDDG